MPHMTIKAEGTGGGYRDVLRRYSRVLEAPENVPLRLETVDRGMQSGAPSLAIIIELPMIREVVLAQTSVKLFQLSAVATYAKYGDQTGGACMGNYVGGGDATLVFSSIAKCLGCGREAPGSCKFCPECGVRL